jgi:hypothetical protein
MCPSPAIIYSNQSHDHIAGSSCVVTHHRSCSYFSLAWMNFLGREGNLPLGWASGWAITRLYRVLVSKSKIDVSRNWLLPIRT